MKQYSWVILLSFVIALVAGVGLSKITPSTSTVNSIMIAIVGAPGTTIPGVTPSGSSLEAATNYAPEIMSRSVMEYVVANNPAVGKRHYSGDDLLLDIVTAPSTTASTVTVTATASNANDCVLLANAVAVGFQNYIQSQRQAALDEQRTKLQTQLNADMKQKASDQNTILTHANTSDPNYILASNDLQNANQQINSVQSQIDQLPTTVSSDIIVIQKAKLIDVQASSKGTLVIAAAGVVGIMIGIMIMFLMIFLDDRLRGEDRVKEKLGMAYLGGVFTEKQIKENPALAKGTAMHQFADIAVNLRLTGVLPGEWQSPKGVALLITSAQPAEGKTSIVAGLASTVARGGGSVVVVDGNLQKPTTHLTFGISSTGPGLAGLLKGTGTEAVDSVVVRSNIPGVWILPGGKEMEDPTLLLGQKFPGILAQLRKKTDLVIVDGPPLLSGSDALLLSTMVDGVALILDSRHDKLKLLLRMKEMLSSLAHTPSGVILNRMPRRKRNSYFASVASSDSTPEKMVPVSTYTGANNGNGNGDLSSYQQRGEMVATINSTFLPMNVIDTPTKMNAPTVPMSPPAPVNGMAMQPEFPMYPPSPQNGANVYPNPPSPRSLLRGVDLSKPRNV
jgi:capsular exopolysaccharide synthesis family protein